MSLEEIAKDIDYFSKKLRVEMKSRSFNMVTSKVRMQRDLLEQAYAEAVKKEMKNEK